MLSVSHIQVKYTTASTTFYLSDGKKEEHDQGKEKKKTNKPLNVMSSEGSFSS